MPSACTWPTITLIPSHSSGSNRRMTSSTASLVSPYELLRQDTRPICQSIGTRMLNSTTSSTLVASPRSDCAEWHEPDPYRVNGRLSPVSNSEFAEDVAHVALACPFVDEELPRNFLVG